jgi:polyhydroxybutyrate depolymerase
MVSPHDAPPAARHDHGVAPRLRHLPALVLVVLLLAACGSAAFPPGTIVVGGSRPVAVVRPPDHDPTVPTPLVVVLHGYGSNDTNMERTFPLGSGAAVAGAMIVRPRGTMNPFGQRFWNAAGACCDIFGSGVDDVGYLMGVLDEIEARVAVDRVVLFGHSNGGFMAYRLACEHGDRFAAVVSVAGALDDPPPACDGPGPPAMLQVHGTRDGVIPYDGGFVFGRPPFTGAERTVAILAERSGCSPGLTAGRPFDLDTSVTGPETTPLSAACPEGRRVALWAVEGAAHEPRVGADFAARVLGFALGD